MADKMREEAEEERKSRQLFCCHCGVKLKEIDRFCGSCGKKIEQKYAPSVPEETPAKSEALSLADFQLTKRQQLSFYKSKQLSTTKRKANNAISSPKEVQINVGTMNVSDFGIFKPVRGSKLPVKVAACCTRSVKASCYRETCKS